MEKQLVIALCFMLAGFGYSCQDECIVYDYAVQSLGSRALYDDGYVEWDGVSSLDYKLGSDEVIKGQLNVPWAPGQAQAMGIPNSWFDVNYLDVEPRKRAYSHVNGWEMIYSNLLDKGQRNKYFALYNKYTGMLRMFFYAMENTSGYGTTTTFGGVQIQGTSSVLNFTYSTPKPMDYKSSYSTYFFAPSCDFSKAVENVETVPISGVSYKANNWYGLEFECAYDATPQNGSTMNVKLWGANISLTKTKGTIIGDIVGDISTVYSNNPSFDLNLSFDNSNSFNITQGVLGASEQTANKINEGVNKGDSFFTGLWNKIKSETPNIIMGGVKEGVKALFSGGVSLLTSTAGKLVSSIFGIGETQIMSSLSEVNLNMKATLEASSTTISEIGGWGEIKQLPFPGCGGTSTLYNEKLGVWNIATTPTVTIDMSSIAYIYEGGAHPYVVTPGKTPYQCDMTLYCRLKAVDLQINPLILQECTLQNVKKEVATTTDSGKPYGLYNDEKLYDASSINYSAVPFIASGFNPDTAFEKTWNDHVASLSDKVYCRISFELKNNTTGEVMGYSKYFKPNVVKGENLGHANQYVRL